MSFHYREVRITEYPKPENTKSAPGNPEAMVFLFSIGPTPEGEWHKIFARKRASRYPGPAKPKFFSEEISDPVRVTCRLEDIQLVTEHLEADIEATNIEHRQFVEEQNQKERERLEALKQRQEEQQQQLQEVLGSLKKKW